MDIVSSTNSAHTYTKYIAPSGNLQHELTTTSTGIQQFKVNGTTQLSIASTGVTVPTLAVSNGLTVAGNAISSTNLLTLDGVAAGTATNGKALVLDATGNITGINSLSATTLTGTLATATQPNITSVGTLSSLAVTGAITSTSLTSTGAVTGATLVGTISTAAQPNITSVGTLSSLTITNGGSLTIGSASLNAAELGFIDGVAAGTATNSKALILGSTGNITGINILSATTLVGTLSTAAQTSITSVGTLSSLTVTNAVTAGSLTVGAVSLVASELGVIDGVTAGTAANSKALVLSGTGTITGISSLSATNLTGTLQTGDQPNITSVGTLSSLTVTGTTTLSGNLNVASTRVVNNNGLIDNRIGIDLTSNFPSNKIFSDLLFYQATGTITGNQVAFYAADTTQARRISMYLINAFINDIKNLENDSFYDRGRSSILVNMGITTLLPAGRGTLPSPTEAVDVDPEPVGGNYSNQWFTLVVASNGSDQIWTVEIAYSGFASTGSVSYSNFQVQSTPNTTVNPTGSSSQQSASSPQTGGDWQLTSTTSPISRTSGENPFVIPVPFTMAMNY